MAKATAQDVDNLFMEYLGRPADPGGSGFYEGKDIAQVAADLAYAAATGVEDVAANQDVTASGGWDFAPPSGGGGGGGSTSTPTKLPPSAYVPTGTYRGGSHKVGGVELVPGAPGYDAAKALPILQKEIAPYDPSVVEYLKTIPGGYNETAQAAVARVAREDALREATRQAVVSGQISQAEAQRIVDGQISTPESIKKTADSIVAGTVLERNPFFPTYQVREDINYDELFGAKPLDQGGTAPTPEAINAAFETFYNRPADTAGIQGYLQSGKSMEQINADLAYQALYAPELSLAPNAQYYEAPSQAQLGYIQSLGGGTPTFEREDTFTYTAPDPLTAEEVTSIYQNQFGYDPTPQDLEYWTQVYAMSPDVRYSPNPRQQTINAILAGSDLPQYQYLKTGTDLTGTQGVTYTGTPINPTQLANQQYSDYRGVPPTQPAAPFGGFFGDDNFNPFDYTGIAPTPGMYRGYDPFATQRAAEINMLGNQYLGGNFEPQGMEFYSTQRSTGRSLADIAADLSASPEGQAFAQTGAPSPERAAISSNPFFAARSPIEAAETLRALDPTLRTANLADQGIVAALPGSTASTP